jgi:predicted N-acyltransferase
VSDRSAVKTHTLTSIDEVTRAEWNALRGTEQPFLRHEFLAALEHQGCVGATSGWVPCHLTRRDASDRLVGALPLYRKLHSWGEFVFDFAWAQAYTRSGLSYYPKLVAAVPFTPATGPRFLVAADTQELRRQLLDDVLHLAREERLSSFHVLFPEKTQAEELASRGLLLRRDCQFHWHNRGYASFEAFLAEFTAEKRKKVHRERRRISEAGVTFRTLSGSDIDRGLWRMIYAFHADTFLRHGHTPYLNLGFFEEIARQLPESIVVLLALHDKHPVAAAICFRSADTLYGRYWGASGAFHSLHFETCYYQGIDYCIRHGLQRFEPGTQGEHKISRGFIPVYTRSAHWIADPRLQQAIGEFVARETHAVASYAADVEEHVPYKHTGVSFPFSPGEG